MQSQLYIRVRGRIAGPFDEATLKSLARRGQFSKIHEVSQDAVSWVCASVYPQLFATETSPHAAAIGQPFDEGRYCATSGETLPIAGDRDCTWLGHSRSAILLLAGGGVLALTVLVVMVFLCISMATSDREIAAQEDDLEARRTSSRHAPSEGKLLSHAQSLAFPGILTDRYITSVKHHDDIRTAVGLVVVGLEIRHGKDHYEAPLLTGSAFAVAPGTGIMLTNRHVVNPFYNLSSDSDWKQAIRVKEGLLCEEKMWVFVAGNKYTASLVHTSPQFDFAVIRTSYKSGKAFRMKLSVDKLDDEEVRAIGFPGNAGIQLSLEQDSKRIGKIQEAIQHGKGTDVKEFFLSHQLQPVLTKGTVCQIASDDAKSTSWLQHTASIALGSSGGPLVLPDATVVGINTGIAGDRTGHGAEFYRAVAITQLRSELDAFVKDAAWVQ